MAKGKSQLKFAGDQVVADCKHRKIKDYIRSDYYWAYRKFFEEFVPSFKLDNYDDYIKKRV
jgi:hypothetical protein